MFVNTAPVPYDRHLAMLDRYLNQESNDCWFMIEVGGEAIGTIALYDLSQETGVCECGRIVISPESRRRGYGGRALELAKAHAGDAGIRKLRCEILSTNLASLRLFQKAGFIPASRREHGHREFIELYLELGEGM